MITEILKVPAWELLQVQSKEKSQKICLPNLAGGSPLMTSASDVLLPSGGLCGFFSFVWLVGWLFFPQKASAGAFQELKIQGNNMSFQKMAGYKKFTIICSCTPCYSQTLPCHLSQSGRGLHLCFPSLGGEITTTALLD